jgi:3-oxoacid CoA-transferase B subunit
MANFLSDEEMAMRMAREIKDGDAVNLGYGIPLRCSSYIPQGFSVQFHTENGIIGFGAPYTKEEVDKVPYEDAITVLNAGAQFIKPLPGMCIVDFAESFDAIRTGRVGVTILGALEVSEFGDISSWAPIETIDNVKPSDVSMGGAMDMPDGPEKVIIGMRHTDKKGNPKIVKKCKFLLAAKRKATLIVTDIAVIKVSAAGLVLQEVAPGWTVEAIQAMTEPRLIISPDLKEIKFN